MKDWFLKINLLSIPYRTNIISRRIFLTQILILLITFFLLSCASSKSFSKPGVKFKGAKVGILQLQCAFQEIGSAVSDALGANLLDSGFRIIERTYLNKIIEEQGLSISGLTTSIDYKKIGQISNVDFLLTGTVIANYRESAFFYGGLGGANKSIEISGVTARIVDVKTGEVVLSATYTPDAIRPPIFFGEELAAIIKKEISTK